MFIFMYSIIAVNFFAQVKISDPLNEHLNFKNIGNAYLTLFVMGTGDNFFEIVNAMSRQKSVNFYCIDHPTYEDYVLNGNETIGCGN